MTRPWSRSPTRWPLGIGLTLDLLASVALWLAILLLVAACQTTASVATRPQPTVTTFCLAFKPIRWSLHDTLETQQQARAHNAAGASLCGWKP